MNTRNKKNLLKIYTIEGINYDAIIQKYRQLCEEGEVEILSDSLSVFGNSEVESIQTRKPRKPLNDDTRILNKAIFLVHTIAYRQATNREEGEGVSILYDLLQRVIGKDTCELLKALEALGYIERSYIYIVGKSSRHYKVIGEITSTECSNYTIRKYIDKTKELLKEDVVKRMTTPQFKALYGEKFAETYIKNLNKFKIKDKKGLDYYINEQIASTPSKESYYNFIKESFNSDFKIYSIDSNNRIYHLLTSLERELKEFLNIRYSIDCKNSHPVLFNYFIFYSKGISIELSYLISSILHSIDSSLLTSTSNNHYDIKKLCNILNSNGIKKSIVTRFAPDELLYIYKTTKGIFWDDILTEHQGEGFDRAEIKQKMFAEVFYSKTPKIAWKEFAKEFKREYPSVYDLILRWKEPLKHDDLKECLLTRKKAVKLNDITLMSCQETALPNVMMDLESVIFRDILKSLYRKRIAAVHIHDAIVIPQTRAMVNVKQIEAVMRDVYRNFGLYPTFSTENYEYPPPINYFNEYTIKTLTNLKSINCSQ